MGLHSPQQDHQAGGGAPGGGPGWAGRRAPGDWTLAPGTIEKIYQTFRKVMAAAVDDDRNPKLPCPALDLTPTHTVSLRLTDKQREAIVALVEGYLLPFPRYDPHPRTYADAALRLGLRRSVVAKRIEKVRLTLVEAGVPGLEGEDDARRHLAEWVLSTRIITQADLHWLKGRRGEGRGPE